MIDLYTAGTPNGYKVTIALEELGVPYEPHFIDLGAKEQKRPEFLDMNPNGRIPVIRDRDNGHVVFESGAILMYLAEKSGRLLPADPLLRSVAIQWLMFQMGGVGPMQGQLGVFRRYAPEPIPYAIERYEKESRRLYGVLNDRLKDRPYLADEYSIADIATFPWVHFADWSGVPTQGLDHLKGWTERITQRPAVQRGLQVPPRQDQEKLLNTGKAMV